MTIWQTLPLVTVHCKYVSQLVNKTHIRMRLTRTHYFTIILGHFTFNSVCYLLNLSNYLWNALWAFSVATLTCTQIISWKLNWMKTGWSAGIWLNDRPFTPDIKMRFHRSDQKSMTPKMAYVTNKLHKPTQNMFQLNNYQMIKNKSVFFTVIRTISTVTWHSIYSIARGS